MVSLNKLMLIPTPKHGYQPVYQRTFNVRADPSTVNTLSNIMGQNYMHLGIDNFPKNVVANELSDVISLSKFPQGNKAVGIENGWGTQRFRFLLETEEVSNGQSIVSYIQGYTSHADVSMSGIIDPRMVFYINSISIMYKHISPDGRLIVTPAYEFNVVSNKEQPGDNYTYELNSIDPGFTKLIRPKDIVEDLAITDQFGDFGNILNTTGSINLDVHTSNRLNNNGIQYLTKTMNGYMEGKSLAGITHDDRDILRNASNQLNELNVSKVGFIRDIAHLTHIVQATSFDLGLLEMMDPTIGQRTTTINPNTSDAVISNLGGAGVQSFLDSEVTEQTLAPSIETMKVAEFMFGVTGIMAETMLSSIAFSITNNSGQLTIIPTNASSLIDGLDVVPYFDRALKHIRIILGPKLTDNNQTLIELHADISLVGDSKIGISVNGGPVIIYRYPIFADSLFVPVITDSATKEEISGNFRVLFDATSGVTGSEFQVDTMNAAAMPAMTQAYNTNMNYNYM